MIDEASGRRYETCAACGEVWNVATVQEVPDDGYVCPKCLMREKQARLSERRTP